jgi:hypothetical protein
MIRVARSTTGACREGVAFLKVRRVIFDTEILNQ